MFYPQRGFTGLDMKRIHGGNIVAENENELIRNRWESRHIPDRFYTAKPRCLAVTQDVFMS